MQIAPWLSLPDAGKAVDFYEQAFGATVRDRVTDDRGALVIAELSLDGATLWVTADKDAVIGTSRHVLIVADPDAAYARAVAAGGTEVAPLHDAHGWRTGRIADPCGLHWELARRL